MALIGQRIRRIEDPQLVRGAARYVGDIVTETPALELAFVRSNVAHARLVSVDVDAARKMPGVHAVLLFDDVSFIPGFSPVPVPDAALRPPLAHGFTRFIGEPIAAVAADSQALAVDAVEAVIVDYESLDAVVDVERAIESNAPRLFADLESNEVIRLGEFDPSDLTAGADIVVDVWFDNQRVAVAPLESNNILAIPDGDQLTVYVSTQSPHAQRDGLASLLGLPPANVHVIAPAVGGGFGAKSVPDAEYVITCFVARQLQRPVRWRQTRTENMLAVHGRGQRQRVRMAATRDGILTAIHADLLGDGGAYPAVNAYLVTLTGRMLAGVYAVPRATSSAVAVATNTAPPTAYRGAGRPEAACLVERAIDVLAAELELDPIEIRRRNFIAKDRFPYTTPTGAVYDTGDYHAALDRALSLSHYAERRREQAERRARDDRHLLGVGVAVYVEVTAGSGPSEFADVEIDADGKATVKVGTFSHGQGHKTTYSQIASDALGIPFADITIIDGDTAKVARGVGTYSSRSVQVGGTAIHVACGQVVEKAKLLAADILEAAAVDIVHDANGFAVAGVPSQRVTWAQAAAHAQARTQAHAAAPPQDDGVRTGLFAEIDWERPNSTFPFGAHVAVVEIDRDTGRVTLIDHTAVDDCGTIINPLLADGQVHGGIAQGAAQALLEEVVYDDTGNLVTSNLADYAFIGAAELPSFTLDHTVTPTHVNPLGAKGIGESGTIGSTAAVHNAVLDAVAHLGVRHIDMPCTAEKVWRAINGEGDDGRLQVWRR
jgi:carbon-monoxide dehydrogenase large subunit